MQTHLITQASGSLLSASCYFLGPRPTLGIFATVMGVLGCITSVPWYLVGWFLLACLHFEVHNHVNPQSLYKTKGNPYDESWHAVNGMMAILYLYNLIDPIRAGIFAMMYILKESLIVYSLVHNKLYLFLYYLGAIQTFFFVTLANPWLEFTLEHILINLVAFIMYVLLVWTYTLEDKYSKILWKMNLAGSAFLAEYVMVYWLYLNRE